MCPSDKARLGCPGEKNSPTKKKCFFRIFRKPSGVFYFSVGSTARKLYAKFKFPGLLELPWNFYI